jgi:hypothetical protein
MEDDAPAPQQGGRADTIVIDKCQNIHILALNLHLLIS